MYYYFKKSPHLYRVKVKNLNAGEHYRLIGKELTCLHINCRSDCVNQGNLHVTTDLEVTTEKEFNDVLNKTLSNLDINYKFKFV